MKVKKSEIVVWCIAVVWFVFATWLLLLPVPAISDDTERKDTIATKDRGSTHGWVYNTKTKELQFCIQTSGGQYDADAEVMCIPYPKKVKIIDEFESFFLDGNEGYLPNE